jgi:hypothetical protein
MKRALLIILCGLIAGIAAYICVFLAGSSPQKSAAGGEQPALAWMRREYKLSDAQFRQLCALHDAYRPKCADMCRLIDDKNAQLQTLLAATNTITPEIRQALAEAAQIRAQCQANMLEHFYAVSQTMPPAQGQRYLAWIRAETLKTPQMLPGGPGSSLMPKMP